MSLVVVSRREKSLVSQHCNNNRTACTILWISPPFSNRFIQLRWVFTPTHHAGRDGGVGFIVLFLFGVLLVPWRFIFCPVVFCFFFQDFLRLWRGQVAITIDDLMMRLFKALNEVSNETLLVFGDLFSMEIRNFEVPTLFLWGRVYIIM
jgi:hypothetical protein